MEKPEKVISNSKVSQKNQANDKISFQENNKSNNNNKINPKPKVNLCPILDEIFIFEKTNNLLSVYPKIDKEKFKNIVDVFNKGIIPNFESNKELFHFIKDKVNAIIHLKSLVIHKYEMLEIIDKFCKKNNFSILEFFIDLYFRAVDSFYSQNPISDILDKNIFNIDYIDKITDSINWIMSCSFIEKKNFDKIFQKLAALQLSSKLTDYKFCEYLNLLEILYGKKNNIKKYKMQLIAPKYIYFYDKKTSGIYTNVSEGKNEIKINGKKGLSIITWFFNSDEYPKPNDLEPIIVEMTINNFLFEIILDHNNDIVVKSQGKLLKCEENIVFNIAKLRWIQFKIQLLNNEFKLFLYKVNDIKELSESDSTFNYYHQKLVKYEIKTYKISNIPNSSLNDLTINKINFYKNYLGIVGSIIFCNSKNNSEYPVKSEFGIDTNDLKKFLSEPPIDDNYFIFAPRFFVNDQNKFIDSFNNITGSFINNSKNGEFNSVFKYKNFTNIYNLGGIENILPLFEIFYKFSIQNKKGKEEDLLHLIFKKLIKILELILINKKNYLESLYVTNAWQNNTFFQSLQLFMELIDEKFYQKDNDILNSLLNIGKNIYNNFLLTINTKNTKNNKNDKYSHFFTYILFNPNIIIKFNLTQIELLWKFFEQKQKGNLRIKTFDFKRCFMTFEQINKYFILLSDKYNKSKKEVNILSNKVLNIIKIIFDNIYTKDNERESLFLLCNYNKLNEHIIYGILDIINVYLDSIDRIKDQNNNIITNSNLKEQKEIKNQTNTNTKNQINEALKSQDPTEIKKKQRISMVNNILNIKNNNVEILLKIFSSKNRTIKKAIIKLLKILILKYTDIFYNYFMEIENSLKKEKISNKVNKEEFFHYLEENIVLNYYFKRTTKDDSKKKLNTLETQNFNNPLENIDFLKENQIKNETKQKNNEINNYINDKENNDKNKQFIRKKRRNSDDSKFKKISIKLENININIKDIRNKARNITVKNKDFIKSGLIIFKQYYNKKQTKEIVQNMIKNNLGENNDNIEVYHINIEDDKISIIENDYSEIITNIEVNIEMSKLLFELLTNYNPPANNLISIDNSTNSKNNGNKKSSLDKSIKSKTINNSNTFEEEKIMNLIVKFLQNTRELEVIHEMLFSISNQKINNNENYNQLLDYFCFTKTEFLQLIEELLINSYLCLNDEGYNYKHIFVNFKKNSDNISKEEYFNLIFMNSNDLLIYLYFHKNIQNANKILDGIINLMLLITKSESKILNYENNKIFNLLLKLLDEFLEEINKKFISKITKGEEEGKKNTEEKSPKFKFKIPFKDSNNDNVYNSSFSKLKPYFEFLPYIFEYCFLKNYDIFVSERHKYYNMKLDAGFPEFSNIKNINNFSLYYNFIKNTGDFFNVYKNLESLKISLKKYNIHFDENKEINIIQKEFLTKLVKDFITNKDYKSELKYKLEIFFIKINQALDSDYLTLVEILTILNNYYIEKYLINQEYFNQKDKCEFNFIYLLNYHQFFIMNIILASCILKDNDSIQVSNKTYKDIQDIFFICLQYNINNLIKNSDSKYSSYFITIFVNIFVLVSKIYEIYNDKSGKINFNKTCLKNLVEYYSNKYQPLFNKENLKNCPNKNFEYNRKLFEEHQKLIFDKVLNRSSEELNANPIINIFEPKKFLKLFYYRTSVYKQMNLLLSINNDMLGVNEFIYYKELYNKIQQLVPPYENKMAFNESFLMVRKRNNYRKIKKKLYSWNNSYSNFDIFFNEKNRDKLKFKVSNFLCKDLTRKLLVPILDFDFYFPKFKKFEWQKYLFRNNKDTPDKSIYETIYNIDLKIFENIPKKILPSLNNQNFIFEEVCYIKTNHHINGLLFFHNNQNQIFFASKKPRPKEELLNTANYDKDNCRCFGSIFGADFSPKEEEMYFKLPFSEIDFIFIRKYCFRNNSIEIFTNRHKSYYFQFESNTKRDNFLDNLINLVNNKSMINRQAFKPIKGFDEYDKSTIIGYIKDDEDIKQYSSISNITELWKSNKISTLEYLMWINVYGNRSYQDIAQYPVFPWLLINYESDTFEKLISKSQNIRDFRIPIGMINILEKGKYRQDGYIESYKLMIMDLDNQEYIDIKVKDEDTEEETTEPEKKDSLIEEPKRNEKNKNDKEKYKKHSANQIASQNVLSVVSINSFILTPKCEKLADDKLQKLPDYSIDINKLYFDNNIPYDLLPYIYGSHYSNAMYVSHYLCRLFPFSFAAIEIQGVGFDCPDRLFINLQNSVISAITEKGDLREIIPDFFCIPEMFLNINNLNLGEIKNKPVENVLMPTWCQNNPYLFIENYRSLLESNNLNLNPWIDLIFGISQKGKPAQIAGNIFLPFAYDGVINYRIPPEDLINNRDENEFKMRLFEMGVNPIKIFKQKSKNFKDKINDEIIAKSYTSYESNKIFYAIKLKNRFKDVIYFSTKQTNFDEIYIIDKKFTEEKLQILEYKEANSYSTKEISSNREFPFTKKIKQNIEYKLIIKQIFHHEIYVITGLFDGKLHLFKNTNKIEKNINEYEYEYEGEIMEKFDRSLITALAIDKDEKYIVYGTQKGSIVVYLLNYFRYKDGDNKNFLNLYKFFQSHPGYPIKYISLNSELNLFADCSYDGFVNIYSFPKCVLFRSIYVESNLKNRCFNLDYVFLSSQPLPSIALYSNEANTFKIFSLNGKEMEYKVEKQSEEENASGMSSPIIFTDSQFNDYLLYILNNKYVFVTKFPTMQLTVYINPKTNDNIYLTNVCISNDKKSIYIFDENNNMIYLVHNNQNQNNNLKA